VIAKPALTRFIAEHSEAAKPLMTWYKLMMSQDFEHFAALKNVFGSADASDNFTIFDVGGNKFRIITRVIYKLHTVFIRNVLTHEQYNHWQADDDPWSSKQAKSQAVGSKQTIKRKQTRHTTFQPKAKKGYDA